jgi:hypothetical protein
MLPPQIPAWLSKLLEKPALDITESGLAVGLNRNQSYRAAQTGYMPTFPVGDRREKVPTSWVRQVLRLDEVPPPPSTEEEIEEPELPRRRQGVTR